MESNTTDSGGRVTRSLRKRLTSVDSDNSSRPGTPVAAKLSSITEISASPSVSTRLTRRNSTSGCATPAKTPAKRSIASSAFITEKADLSTPKRRNTRRRSISVNESEESHQPGIKVPPFPSLAEENTLTEVNSPTKKRITRSQSTSPKQEKALDSKIYSGNKNNDLDFAVTNDSSKRRKPGPKSKTHKPNDADDASDVEISVLEKGVDEIKSKSTLITTFILTDDESSQMWITSTNIDKVQEENSASRQSNLTDGLVLAERNTNVNALKINNLMTKENRIKGTDKSSGLIETMERKCVKDEGEKRNESMPSGDFTPSAETVTENSNKENVRLLSEESKIILMDIKNSDSSEKQSENQIVNISGMKYTEPKLEINEGTKTEVILNNSNINEQKEIMETNEVCINKIEIVNIKTFASYQQDTDKENLDMTNSEPSSKKVDFDLSPSNNINIKNIYPKTPAVTKTKVSFVEIDSLQDEDSFQAGKIEQTEGLYQIHKADVEEKEINSTDEINETPRGGYDYIQKLKHVQSSTPRNMEVSPNVSLIETDNGVKKQDEKQTNECANTQPDTEEEETQMKWINPCVKGITMEGSKLDRVVIENVTERCKSFNETESENQDISERNKKSIVFTSDDDDEESNNQILEVDEDEELELGEKEYRKKHDFHDDEAMEVQDYESGDSMDSEEREDIIDNEIPVDGESIGSHTTDDENTEVIDEEEEGVETDDSFIVSDNEEVECLDSDDQNELENKSQENKDIQHNSGKKKSTYIRLQVQSESSSSDVDVESRQLKDETEVENIILEETNSNVIAKQSKEENKESTYKELEENSVYIENEDKEKVISGNQSEINSISKSGNQRLQCSTENESDKENTVEEKQDTSRKEILRKLNTTDRFNKSIRELNIDIDMSSAEDMLSKSSNDSISEFIEKNKIEKLEDKFLKDDRKSEKQYESVLEVSVATHNEDDKGNEHKVKLVSNEKQLNADLSTSFDNLKKTGYQNTERKEWQRSFTIDVTVKGGQLDATVTDLNPKEMHESVALASPIVHDFTDQKNENADLLENLRHMPLPLSNPLFRSRRQSLALPTNPNMEICSSNVNKLNRKSKRMSLGILNNSDFKPSQSFIDSIELNKPDHKDLVVKRKRLSKSFCGASETLDNSLIDIDVRQLTKRSRITEENSFIESHDDSSGNINATKKSNKISSTPHEKNAKVDLNNSIQRILSRCDEILETANRAKLEVKTNFKKSKKKLSKKQKKGLLVPSHEINKDGVLRRIPKDIKRKDKIKTAVTHAIKAANEILNEKHLGENRVSNRLPSKILEGICNFQAKVHCYQTTATTAGDFVEMPQSPKKRKKQIKYIQLPTGKVSVEPVTPKKRSVQACNGREFIESPVTPYASGFKVREIPTLSEITLKGANKKRNYDEQNTLPKPQWTQSGTFFEENISIKPHTSCTDKSHFKGELKKSKNSVEYENLITDNCNFKQKAMMRPDVKRSSNREVLLLRERRRAQGRYQ